MDNNLPSVEIIEEPLRKKPKLLNARIIFAILGVVIIVEMILLIQTFLSPPAKILEVPRPVSEGQIIIHSDKSNMPVGDNAIITVKISTGGRTTDGVDLVLHFDPEKLEAKAITKGAAYQEYPVESVDNSNGIIRVSGITQTGFNGMDVLTQIEFKAKSSGKTTISAEFKPGVTTDSNIIETGSTNDILGAVYNADLIIGGLEVKDGSKSSEQCNGFSQVCIDKDGRQGFQQCSGGKFLENLCSFDPLLTESCGECITR